MSKRKKKDLDLDSPAEDAPVDSPASEETSAPDEKDWVPAPESAKAEKPTKPGKMKSKSKTAPVEPVPAKSAEPVKPKVRLEVFLRIAGPRWDQLAGFKHYAKRNNLGPLTVQEWRDALQAYKTRPTQ